MHDECTMMRRDDLRREETISDEETSASPSRKERSPKFDCLGWLSPIHLQSAFDGIAIDGPHHAMRKADVTRS